MSDMAALKSMRDLPEHLDAKGFAFSKDFARDYMLAIDTALGEEGE